MAHRPIDTDGASAVSETERFKTAMNGLLSTLHTVDVQMRRQVMGLEEAGIIVLGNEKQETDGRTVVKASLQPNAVGNVGNLDGGWLNSRGGKVERDMEAELWKEASAVLDSTTATKQTPT